MTNRLLKNNLLKEMLVWLIFGIVESVPDQRILTVGQAIDDAYHSDGFEDRNGCNIKF